MGSFYNYFLTEVEAPGVIDADADPAKYQAQISDAAFKIAIALSGKLRMSNFTRNEAKGAAAISIMKDGAIHKIPIDIVYDESTSRGVYYFEGLITINSRYYDEEDWSSHKFANTFAHEINHAVDDLKGLVDKPVSYSKHTKGLDYYFNSYEFKSFLMDMRTHLEAKLRGFTHKGKYVEPEAVVKYLKEYVRLGRELAGMARKKVRDQDFDQYMRLLRSQEIALSLMLFGSEYRNIILLWRRTPVFLKFLDFVEQLASKWEYEFV